jgi:hypothetical protein
MTRMGGRDFDRSLDFPSMYESIFFVNDGKIVAQKKEVHW